MSLSTEELAQLKDKIKFRDDELDLLNSFISRNSATSANSLILHGYKSIGKSYTLNSFLKSLGVKHSIIRCDECITKKVLLQRCFKSIKVDSGVGSFYSLDGAQKFGALGENFSSFIGALEGFIQGSGYNDNHVLVLDRFDQCMEPTNELFPAFARLQEQTSINNITIVFVISTDDPKQIVTSSLPHVYFRNYGESEVLSIISANQLCYFGIESIDSNPASAEFWKQYCKIIVDLYFPYTGSDMGLLINICSKVWPRFIEPVLEGKYKLHEFVKVYRDMSEIFNNENIINNSTIRDFQTLEEEKELEGHNVDDLPVHSKFILMASYLASFNAPKNDLHYFSKLQAIKNKKRAITDKGKRKRGHMTKDDIDSRLLQPNYFDLERMLAILGVIYRTNSRSLNVTDNDFLIDILDNSMKEEGRKELERSKITLSRNIDLNSQISTLFSLGLMSKSASSDILGARVRWKCNVNWSTIERLAKDTDFPIVDYLGNE